MTKYDKNAVIQILEKTLFEGAGSFVLFAEEMGGRQADNIRWEMFSPVAPQRLVQSSPCCLSVPTGTCVHLYLCTFCDSPYL